MFAVGLLSVCSYLSGQDSCRCVESVNPHLSRAVASEMGLPVSKPCFLQKSISRAALGQVGENQGSVASRAKKLQMSELLGLESRVTARVRSVLHLNALFI